MATNGLQLAIYTAAGSKVDVRGMNQNNQASHWIGTADKNGVAFTHNWWWKGPVAITSWHNGLTRSTTASVPTFDISDTYSVNMSLLNPMTHS